MRTLGAAVIGTGFIGPVHVEAIRRLGHRVVGVLGSTPNKSRAAADAMAIPRGYADLAELLADPTVDVVHVASPNRDHFAQTKQVLEAGKHVVCEKPLAMTTAETAELVILASVANVVAAVNYNVRFYPLVLDMRARVRAGDLGDVLHVCGSYLQDWLLRDTDFNWRVLAEHGGPLRAVADIGTHWLDTVCFVTGLEVEAVFADLQTVHAIRHRPTGGSETFSGTSGGKRETVPVSIDTEDCGSILIRFRGGARGTLTVSQVAAGRKNQLRFDLAGSKAAFAWDSERPDELHVGHRGRGNELVRRDPTQLHPDARPFSDYPGGHAEGFPDTFKQLYRAVYGTILNTGLEAGATRRSLRGSGLRAGEDVYATFADGHDEVRVCEAILASHRQQRWVTVG